MSLMDEGTNLDVAVCPESVSVTIGEELILALKYSIVSKLYYM